MSAPSVAIIGSGPSGCYMAQALRKHWAEAQIVIFDRLPVPYGLVRYGVAPDHPGTKAITRQFERMFERDGIHFAGNVEIGRCVSLEALRAAFDVVVIASGLSADRPLGIEGDEATHVYGAGRITRLLNDHPDEAAFRPVLGRCPVIVGNGNVAIDVLRLLAKSPMDFQGSELSCESLAHLAAQDIQEVHIVGRSCAVQAKFDTVMIRELDKLQNVRFQISDDAVLGEASDADQVAKLQALLDLTQRQRASATRRVVFHFGSTPQSIRTSNGAVAGLQAFTPDGNGKLINATSLITAVGFQELAGACLKRDSVGGETAELEKGLLDQGLFCTGWYRRGPTGTIPDNRHDAKQVAEQIVADWLGKTSHKKGLAAIAHLLAHSVSYQDWQNIDKAERSAAPEGRQRRKFRDTASLLKAAHITISGDAS